MGKIFRRMLAIIPAAALQVLWIFLLMKWLHLLQEAMKL